MISRFVFAIVAALLLGDAGAQDSTDFIKDVQKRLTELGFYAGPVNGDFGPQTQAALAQFQLSNVLPASGQIDVETALELGVSRDASAASGGTRGESRATPESQNAGGG